MTELQPIQATAPGAASQRVRRAWLWPFCVPQALARGALQGADRIGQVLERRGAWLVLPLLAGTLPFAVAPLAGMQAAHLATALLLVPLLLAAVARDSLKLGAGVLAVAFASHSVVAIGLAARSPELAAAVFPAGEAYWRESHAWIVTGESLEYDLNWWLPAHLQLLGAVWLLSYGSLGLVTLSHGFYQVDLMNVYVGRLAASSYDAGLAVALGWHAWSLCRGIGLLLVTFETVSFSFERFTGRRLSTPPRRRTRWLAGLALLVLDGAMKYTLLEPVRQSLGANLGR